MGDIIIPHSNDTIIPHSWGIIGFMLSFPEGICSKVNFTAGVEFELANYDLAVQYFSHYATEIPWFDRNTWYHVTVCKKKV